MLIDKDKWDDIGYNIITVIRAYLINRNNISISLYGGLVNVGMAVSIMQKKSGHYRKCLNSINELLIDLVDTRLEYISEKEELSTNYFDTIVGMAGVCEYFLQLNDKKYEATLRKILCYLASLVKEQKYNNQLIPGWYVNGKNQVTNEYKKEYSEGSINYSLSHGIAGPLKVLASAYKRHVYIDEHVQIISRILDEYKKVGSHDIKNDICLYPGIVSVNDYISGNYYMQPNNRMSWCYGNIGILRSLYLASVAIDDIEMRDIIISEYQKISELNTRDFLLNSPIICHGYAGAVAIFKAMYNDTRDDIIKQQCIRLLDNVISYYNSEYMYGFRDYMWETKDGTNVLVSKDKNDFLEGAGGIILELLSFIKEDNEFDNMLLIKM